MTDLSETVKQELDVRLKVIQGPVYAAEVTHGTQVKEPHRHLTIGLPGLGIGGYASQVLVVGMEGEELWKHAPCNGKVVRGELFWSRQHPGRYVSAMIVSKNWYVNTFMLSTNDKDLVHRTKDRIHWKSDK